MKIVERDYVIDSGGLRDTQDWSEVVGHVEESISKVVWPVGSSRFTINPTKEGNGVKPIKVEFINSLRHTFKWETEYQLFDYLEQTQGLEPWIRPSARRSLPGRVDAYLKTPIGPVALEWETGNISSSHRAVNKMALGLLQGKLAAGILILPTRPLYEYLTDRIGNISELRPYFQVWHALPVQRGILLVYAIEHDDVSRDVPLIGKGRDGLAPKLT